MDGYAYVDGARDGESNMAIDRRLLEIAEHRQCALVRVYRWIEPTLSLGHFQATVDRAVHPPSAKLKTVLRASGGGAIVHHHEWTYSIAIPVGINKIGASTHLYDLVHDALVIGLRGLGYDARKWRSDNQSEPSASVAATAHAGPSFQRTWPTVAQPNCGEIDSKHRQAAFLCFQRRSCGDIVCGDVKVVGSAQRRFGSSVLQHGSILCSTSPFAPELLGLAELVQLGADLADRENGRRPNPFSKKAAQKDENFGYDVLSWVVAPLFKSLGVCCTISDGPPDLVESWSCSETKRETF